MILLLLDVKLALITFLIFPVMAVASLAFRIASADAYRRTRETISAHHAATCRRRSPASGSCARSARSRATSTRFVELNEINRAANMTTVNLNAAYFPVVEFLSSRRDVRAAR